MQIDAPKARRESMRWNTLLILNNARPVGAHEALVLSTLQCVYPDATPLELRRELEYLSARNLIELKKDPSGHWMAELTHYGIDIAEYTIECHPGIARPAKYWVG
ncbi:MAG: hypothetical protein I8H73_06090 [Pseudomonadales bacterium]|nr:hypothetical protein [Pseudomonadales bacterium]